LSENSSSRNPIVVALDVNTPEQALGLVRELSGLVGMFKIGKELFTSAGPDIVRRIIDAGERVFLDLKFHDIPNTVAKAGVAAARLGVSIFNVHALGGSAMMRAVAEAVDDVVARESIPRPKILGVTILTSHTRESLAEVGIDSNLESEVVRLARLCEASGIDGVVASPREISPIRNVVKNSDFVILTPGVRPPGSALNDQKRVMTPLEALEAGANYLVIGRPITASPEPGQAAERILAEIRGVTGADGRFVRE